MSEREYILDVLREVKAGYDRPGAEYNSGLYRKLDLAIQWLEYGIPFNLDLEQFRSREETSSLRISREKK